MKVIALMLGALCLMGNNELPPARYQINPPPSVIVVVDDTNAKDTCGVAKKGWRFQGCEFNNEQGVPIILMPNPCAYPEAIYSDSYAHLLCHEFGHANGWHHDGDY